MKITKIGHCCLLIETNGRRVMTDPGGFTVADHVLANIDIIVYTHEHGDHFHLDSLRVLLEKNPNAVVIANSGVGALLEAAGIGHQKLEGTDTTEVLGVVLEACDATHAEIFEAYGQVQNTGYFIAERLFYPGDAWAEPGKSVEILALPVGGPWCRVADAIAYAHKLKPQVAFPVHDGLLNETGVATHHRIVGANLAEAGVLFRPMDAGDTEEL